MYLLIQIYFIQLEVLGNTFIKFLCLERSERNDTFDEQIFNALVEKIEILTPAHFVFELKSGMRVDEIVE